MFAKAPQSSKKKKNKNKTGNNLDARLLKKIMIPS